jgi:hypothetical protein
MSQIRDEFTKLMEEFSQGASGGQVDLKSIFKRSVEFFEHLKELIKSGTPEEKKEALQVMTEMYQQMQAETEKICQKTGMSPEQLNAFASDPKNFSPEQYKEVQEAKDELTRVGQDLAEAAQSGMGAGDARQTLKADSIMRNQFLKQGSAAPEPRRAFPPGRV